MLNQIPKRIIGALQGKPIQPTEGWGLYFQEGWNEKVIIHILFALFLLGSLVFGILWSILKMDIQGAFGVSAYIVTAGGIFLSVLIFQT